MLTNPTILLCFVALLIPYYCLPGRRSQYFLLLGMNFLFYALACGSAVVWLGALCPLCWCMGHVLAKHRNRPLLASFVGMVLALLIGVRYLPDNAPSVLLPIGLSFFGMQIISYLVDIYRGQPEGSILECALFISFFPTVTSGPILKWHSSAGLFNVKHRFRAVNLQAGFQRFTVGLLKKLVIADRLAIAVEVVYSQPGIYSGLSLLCATIGYGLQLYMDFSGYSDMAIGIAEMMDIRIPENFNMPYLSENLSEFWKRWHISLSAWLTEYVYIPLGGNRRGTMRTRFNSVITMFVSGLWHGFSLNYLLWGFLHGVLLNIQKASFGLCRNLPRQLCACLNTLLVCLLWIPFRAGNLADAWRIFSRIVLLAPGIRYYYGYTLFYGAIVAAVSIYTWRKRGKEKPTFIFDLTHFQGKFLFVCELLIIAALASLGNSAFIYAQF